MNWKDAAITMMMMVFGFLFVTVLIPLGDHLRKLVRTKLGTRHLDGG